MKSKITVLVGLTCLVATTATLAWDNPYDNNSGDRYQGSSGNTYQSGTGSNYKYNLNRADDRIRYKYDIKAQTRDKYNPRVGIDRSLNQYGGGLEY